MTTQHFGSKLTKEGYQHDSMGLRLDPGAIYNVTRKDNEVVTIYRLGLKGKREAIAIKRTVSHG